MKNSIVLLASAFMFFSQCKSIYKMPRNTTSDKLGLGAGEQNAVFLAINHVDILKIKGMEFYHFFVIILTKDPTELSTDFEKRISLFYNIETRDSQENQVVYFDDSKWKANSIWETTISASSECGYDPKAKKLGQLIKAPNYDRMENNKSGRRVFVKRIAVNDISIIKKILEFEQRYDNSMKYALLPEIKQNGKGYNSNSYCRGVLEYAGLIDKLEVPRCFKSPGITKTVRLPE